MDSSIIIKASLNHINTYLRVGHHVSFEATTIDGTDTGKRTDVQLWLLIRQTSKLFFNSFQLVTCFNLSIGFSRYLGFQTFILCFRPRRPILIITIDRVLSLISATIEFTYDDRRSTSTGLFNIHRNRTIYLTAGLVSTEHTLELTAGNREAHIALNVSHL